MNKARWIECDEEDQYYGEWDGENFIFTDIFLTLDFVRQTYVILHEVAHFLCGDGYHDEKFYSCLEKMLVGFGWKDWAIAREIEQVYPASWNR